MKIRFSFLTLLLLVLSCQKPPANLEDRPLFLISKNGKFGFIDREGKIRVKPQFYSLDDFHEGLARAKILDGGWGYIDKIETVIIPFQFEDAENFSNGTARVKSGGKWQTIDHKGAVQQVSKSLEPAPITRPEPLAGLLPAKIGEKWGYRDASGKVAIQPQFDWANDFHDGLAKVEIGKDEAYIDQNGTFVWRYAR